MSRTAVVVFGRSRHANVLEQRDAVISFREHITERIPYQYNKIELGMMQYVQLQHAHVKGITRVCLDVDIDRAIRLVGAYLYTMK